MSRRTGVRWRARTLMINKSTSPVLLSSVVAGVASVVCSYNVANGMYASEKNHAMDSFPKDKPRFQEFAIPQESVLYCTVVRNDYATRSHTHLSNAHTRLARRPQGLKICEGPCLLSHHLAVFLITNIRQIPCAVHPVNDRSDWPLTVAAGSVQHADWRPLRPLIQCRRYRWRSVRA